MTDKHRHRTTPAPHGFLPNWVLVVLVTCAIAVAGLFQTLSSKPWGTQETLQSTASVLLAILGTAPGQVTLHDELSSILRTHGNRWMTTAELAAEVNRRGRHWKATRNRITAAKVLGRVKLYARTFERVGERVRLLPE